MADPREQSPSLTHMYGGPSTAMGGNKKPGGFDRPGGNQTMDNDTRVAPSTTAGS